MTTTPITRRTGLNRTVLLRAGAPWHGHRAGRVLGATGLSGIVADAAARAAVSLDDAPLVTLDRTLVAGEQWAEAVAEQWTDALAHLLQTLRSPTDDDRAAREEWGEEDWARWASVRQVVLCGGVVAGELGRRASRDPRVVAQRAELAPEPGRAPLLGLAAGLADGLVLDLGHSSIKAAAVRDGVLARTTGMPVPWRPFDTSTWPSPDTVLGLVVEAARDAMDPSGPDDRDLEVRVAIANYVVDGLLDDDPTYGTLRSRGPDPRRVLGHALTRGLRRPCAVTVLLNDGAAAALGVRSTQPGADAREGPGRHDDQGRGEATTAVISIGTSLGLGFADA